MNKALLAGSFNPLTLGHIDIIERAAPLFETLCIGIATNIEKSSTLFSSKEVEDMLKFTTRHLSNVKVMCFSGLTVDFAKQNHINVLIRALRSLSDFDWEMSLACANRQLSGIETFLMFGDPKYDYISSKLVREIAAMGGKLSGFVPSEVEKLILKKITDLQ